MAISQYFFLGTNFGTGHLQARFGVNHLEWRQPKIVHPLKVTAGYRKWWVEKGNSLWTWQLLVSILDFWGGSSSFQHVIRLLPCHHANQQTRMKPDEACLGNIRLWGSCRCQIDQITLGTHCNWSSWTRWWFQPIWTILISEIGSFPQVGVKKKYLKPPPRSYLTLPYV